MKHLEKLLIKEHKRLDKTIKHYDNQIKKLEEKRRNAMEDMKEVDNYIERGER